MIDSAVGLLAAARSSQGRRGGAHAMYDYV